MLLSILILTIVKLNFDYCQAEDVECCGQGPPVDAVECCAGAGPDLTPEVKTFPEVTSPAGDILGSWMETRKGRRFESYRGIRYAESPSGPLRFQPPQPILKYESRFNASVEGPACPTLADEYYYGNFSEDCLRLNVYTPSSKTSTPLPVIVFIHPGGFYSMSGRSDLAGPHYLLDRDIVLVTINYRLGSLGYLSTGEKLAPGNNGMLDQAIALQWVNRNIEAFGGDKNLVTVAGCSAGSISALLMMISPMTNKLFHRAISSSASPISKERTPHDQKDLAIQQADILNCPNDSTKSILDCLKTKTWRQIGDSLLGFFTFGFDPLSLWAPIVEPDFGQQRFLSEDPRDAIKGGRFHSVPHLITVTREEFLWKAFTILNNSTLRDRMNSEWETLAPISFNLPRNENTTNASHVLRNWYLGDKLLTQGDNGSIYGLGRLYGDTLTAFPIHRMANLMCRRSKHPVYYGLFDYVGDHSHYEDPVTGKPIAAMHHDDLIYLFSLSYRFPLITPDSPHSAFVDKMTAIWYQFAKYGDMTPRGDIPELTSFEWPAMTPEDRKYLVLNNVTKVERNLFEDRFQVWEDLYPMEY